MPPSINPRPLLLAATLALAAAGGSTPSSAATEHIILHIGQQHITATMENNAAAQAFLRQLPLSITLEDFNRGAEKIYHPEHRLTAEGCQSGCAPQPGDITIYLPWGNLAIFCRPSHHSEDLIRIGRIDHGGIQALQIRGDIPVRIERLPRTGQHSAASTPATTIPAPKP